MAVSFEALDTVPGFAVPVHRALTEPILLGGAPRSVAILNGTLAGAVGLGLQLWLAGILIWAVGHIAAVWAAKRDPLFVEQRTGFILEARIPDLARTAAHEDDRLVAGLLEPPEQHDLHQAADVQRRRGGVEADVTGNDLPARQSVKRGGVGELMDVASLVERAEEVGAVGHGGPLSTGSSPR